MKVKSSLLDVEGSCWLLLKFLYVAEVLVWDEYKDPHQLKTYERDKKYIDYWLKLYKDR